MKNNKKRYFIQIDKKKAPYHSDPTIIFKKLCYHKPYTLMLESAEIKKKINIESMLIIDSAIRIIAINNIVYLKSLTKNGHNLLRILDEFLPKEVKNIILLNGRKIIFNVFFNKKFDEEKKKKENCVLKILRILVKIIKNNNKDKKKNFFFGGLFSYDLILNFEYIKFFKPLKRLKQCPDFCFYLSENLLIFDHKKKSCFIHTSFFCTGKKEQKQMLKKRNKILKIIKILKKKKYIFTIKNKIKDYICNKDDQNFIKMIKKAKKKIKLGEIFQTVISRIFITPCKNPLTAYQYLKKNNPSPYMFFMQDTKFNLFGASPESSLKYNSINRLIEIHPIAGTRPRGRDINGKINFDLDNRIELEMRTNKKELSEHIMLVDLARNDLSKICIPGTRKVSYLTKVDRYLYVMHLVSKVVGKLRYDLDIFHAYLSCMNMGTLSGAPKIRAMQIISNIEKERRYSYGGSIGYFNSFGNLDTCIIIRSAYIENEKAYIQAGAGIVLDSIPIEECEESKNKAKAVIDSIIKTNE